MYINFTLFAPTITYLPQRPPIGRTFSSCSPFFYAPRYGARTFLHVTVWVWKKQTFFAPRGRRRVWDDSVVGLSGPDRSATERARKVPLVVRLFSHCISFALFISFRKCTWCAKGSRPRMLFRWWWWRRRRRWCSCWSMAECWCVYTL